MLSDGFTQSLHFDINQSLNVRYFTYLPPSQKFQLAVESSTTYINASYSINIKKFSTKNIANETRLLKAQKKKPSKEE